MDKENKEKYCAEYSWVKNSLMSLFVIINLVWFLSYYGRYRLDKRIDLLEQKLEKTRIVKEKINE